MTIHGIAAATLNVKELELEPDEAKDLTKAINEVAKHYPIGISEKSMAWANLGIVAIGVYGTRCVAYGLRKKEEKKRLPPPGPRAMPNAVREVAPTRQDHTVNGAPQPPTQQKPTATMTDWYQAPPVD